MNKANQIPKRYLVDTIDHLLLSIGGSIIAGSIVAFFLSYNTISDELLPKIFLIGLLGFVLVLIAESRIYNIIYISKKK